MNDCILLFFFYHVYLVFFNDEYRDKTLTEYLT